MNIKYEKVSSFNRGILLSLLKDSYSFNSGYEKACLSDWISFDKFFFDNLHIADMCGFISTLNDKPIGFVSWDPRNKPEYVEIGHNCISSYHKGKGFGKAQLQEAMNRILKGDVRKVIVTTNDDLIPAQRMYESVGFKVHHKVTLEDNTGFVKEHIHYEFILIK